MVLSDTSEILARSFNDLWVGIINFLPELVVALIITGILITLALGVSGLLVDALRDSRQLVEKTRAWSARKRVRVTQ